MHPCSRGDDVDVFVGAELGAGEVEGHEEVVQVKHVAKVCPADRRVGCRGLVGAGKDNAGGDEAPACSDGEAQAV